MRGGYDQVNQQQDNNFVAPTPILSRSFKICQCCGINVRIHILLPIFFVLSFIFWARMIAEDTQNWYYYVILILMYNVTLWVVVLIHEFGHAYNGYLIGGNTDEILLWPLGGLAFTSGPLHVTDESKKRRNNIIISFGGPMTHIPWMIVFGLLLWWNGKSIMHAGIIIDNPFKNRDTWSETIYTPINEWIDYNYLLMGFMLNFYLLVINLLLPAFPLDGSRIFMNLLRQKWGYNTCAKIYCGVNGVFGVAFILFAYLYLKNGSMLQFAGLWAFFQIHIMVQHIMQGREHMHPLLAS